MPLINHNLTSYKILVMHYDRPLNPWFFFLSSMGMAKSSLEIIVPFINHNLISCKGLVFGSAPNPVVNAIVIPPHWCRVREGSHHGNGGQDDEGLTHDAAIPPLSKCLLVWKYGVRSE